MRKYLVGLFILFSVAASAKPKWPGVPYYQFQFGITAGVNTISAPLTRAPGSHWGAFVRMGNHVIGFKREWDGEFLRIWGEPAYYKRTGIYYVLMQTKKNFQWGPQLFAGVLNYNSEVSGYPSARKVETGFFLETGITATVHARGNGLGGKVFLNLNRYDTFLGGTLFIQLGFAGGEKTGSELKPANSTDTR